MGLGQTDQGDDNIVLDGGNGQTFAHAGLVRLGHGQPASQPEEGGGGGGGRGGRSGCWLAVPAGAGAAPRLAGWLAGVTTATAAFVVEVLVGGVWDGRGKQPKLSLPLCVAEEAEGSHNCICFPRLARQWLANLHFWAKRSLRCASFLSYLARRGPLQGGEVTSEVTTAAGPRLE